MKYHCLYQFKLIKRKGKLQVVREWDNGYFPVNPVSGIDIRSKSSNMDYHTDK